jgi:two-component system chemotaxis response regulator CheB
VQLVVIAASTGGPPALMRLLPRLPGDFPAPIAIVQHMPPLFTQAFAQRLDEACALTVCEAVHAGTMAKGQVHIAPGGKHLEVTNRMTHRVELNDGPMVNSVRPSADVLFRSAARSHGAGVLAVVLTGMGHDGLEGARAVREAGGTVIVQDRTSCTVWGMPRAIEEDGLADLVLPLDAIADELIERARTGR